MKSSGFRSRRLEEAALPGGWGRPWSRDSSLLAVKWPGRAVTPVWVWPRTHCRGHGLCWWVCQGGVRPALWPGGVGRRAGFGGSPYPLQRLLCLRGQQLLRSVSATLPVSLLHPDIQPRGLPLTSDPPSPRPAPVFPPLLAFISGRRQERK